MSKTKTNNHIPNSIKSKYNSPQYEIEVKIHLPVIIQPTTLIRSKGWLRKKCRTVHSFQVWNISEIYSPPKRLCNLYLETHFSC